MAIMGKYCKAYMLSRLQEYSAWKEATVKLKEKDDLLDDEFVIYIQEDYRVTNGVYKDEGIIFDEVNDEWRSFCHDVLEFEIPDYVIEAEKAVEEM